MAKLLVLLAALLALCSSVLAQNCVGFQFQNAALDATGYMAVDYVDGEILMSGERTVNSIISFAPLTGALVITAGIPFAVRTDINRNCDIPDPSTFTYSVQGSADANIATPLKGQLYSLDVRGINPGGNIEYFLFWILRSSGSVLSGVRGVHGSALNCVPNNCEPVVTHFPLTAYQNTRIFITGQHFGRLDVSDLTVTLVLPNNGSVECTEPRLELADTAFSCLLGEGEGRVLPARLCNPYGCVNTGPFTFRKESDFPGEDLANIIGSMLGDMSTGQLGGDVKFLEEAVKYQNDDLAQFSMPRYVNPSADITLTLAFTGSHPLEVLVTAPDQRDFPTDRLTTLKLHLVSQESRWSVDANDTFTLVNL